VVTGISPSFSVSGKTSVCAGEQLVLTAAGAYSYSWSSGATTSSALVKPAQTQTYTVTAKDGSCSTTKTHSVAVNPCLGVAGYNQKAANVYPNPFGSWLKVQAEEHCIIEILDVNGKTVLKKVLQEKESEVSTQYIAPGVYLVKMSGDQWRWQGKFVKAGQD
jgi:VCBS repeat-containing protein